MKKFDPKNLPYIAALASAILLTYAGVDCWGAWGWAIGPGVGITASLSIATASSNIGSITSKGRRRLAYVMLALMLIVGPATVALSLYAPKSVYTAIAWGAAVDVSIVLAGAISGKGFVNHDETLKPVTATPKPPRNRKSVAEKRLQKPIKDDELLSFFAGNPGATNTDAAQHFGVTRQAIGKRVKKLYEVKQ